MRLVLSIPLLILILGSGMTLNVATHYCCGAVAATRVALYPELASCGMKPSAVNKITEDAISKHCCEDKLTSYCVNANYIPSYYSIYDPDLQVIHYEYVQADYTSNQTSDKLIPEKIIRPPGTCSQAGDLLQILCVLRI